MSKIRMHAAALHLAATVALLCPAWWADRHRSLEDPFFATLGPLLDVVPFSALAVVLNLVALLPAYVLLHGAAGWLVHRRTQSKSKGTQRSAACSSSAGRGRAAPQHHEVELASERHQRVGTKVRERRTSSRSQSNEQRRGDDDALGIALLGLSAEQAWSDSAPSSSEPAAPDTDAGGSSYDSDSSAPSFDGGGGDFGGGGSSGEW
jgi:uncharacterized membrane protein YgcG